MSESYRQTRNYENLNRCIYLGVGEYDIPELEPVHCDADTWIGFNYAKGCDVEDRPAHSVHFFIDDYQFNRLWTAPDVYMSMLSGFHCVATPGFFHVHGFPQSNPDLQSLSQALAGPLLAGSRVDRHPDYCMEYAG